jgi:hypothetical protein
VANPEAGYRLRSRLIANTFSFDYGLAVSLMNTSTEGTIIKQMVSVKGCDIRTLSLVELQQQT